ncbi:UDP-N-acetyl-D-mannosamine dehydrogenase [Gottfriedia acidiceleris]|uniref:UDP-N-acetyl-D-mannosamine dehydrogenase n=1 Tax=Gottfriedia acidiceleris TaxID=371036 RepID=UPI00101C4F41|nr:UDP-N-acetyl-D-mannosamine dehydrogenase [Gottfriedia acidiceleris]
MTNINTKVEFNKVCVVGLGYIGLPTASIIASSGIEVHGIEVNEEAINKINQGKIHIYEPDLDILVQDVVKNNKLKASKVPEQADVFIIAVPTPFKENHKPDLSYVESATRTIAPHIKPGNLVILESTSPVGATEKVAEILRELRPELLIPKDEVENEHQVYVSYCPERVIPGRIIIELRENDRILGGINPQSAKKTVRFYSKFVSGKLLETNARTAEMAKLTENSFRDVNIAFANELSMICDDLNINVWELIKLANHHPRVNILQPGTGVGGHCIAVDPWFIVDTAPEKSKLIKTARQVNDYKPEYVVNKIIEILNGNKDLTITCLGLAYKPDVDDLRESPAIEAVNMLRNRVENKLYVVEPFVEELPKTINKNIKNISYSTALEVSDVIIILVGHQLFMNISNDISNKIQLLDFIGLNN